MPKDYVISLKFDGLAGFSKMKSGLAAAVALFCIFPPSLGSETLTLTTYYPAPFAAYSSLLTTGRTLLARDGDNVRIGAPALTPSAPNGAAGNLDVNDIYLRAESQWATRLPMTKIYTAGKVAGLSCALVEETLTGGGCNAGWSFNWGPWTITIPRWCIGAGKFKICWGPYSFTIPGFSWGIVVSCGTVPAGDRKTMWFIYPAVPPATTWISCVRNR